MKVDLDDEKAAIGLAKKTKKCEFKQKYFTNNFYWVNENNYKQLQEMETEQYANDLIERYKQVTLLKGTDYTATFFIALQCAIIDINNTIEALGTSSYNLKKKIFYKEVLTILVGKL